MARYSGTYYRGASKDIQAAKRAEAEKRSKDPKSTTGE